VSLADGAEIGCGTVTLFCHLKSIAEESVERPVIVVQPVEDEEPQRAPEPPKPSHLMPPAPTPSKPAMLPKPAQAAKPAQSRPATQPKPQLPRIQPAPKAKTAPSYHLDLHCGTATLMSALRADVKRMESNEEVHPLFAPGLLPDEGVALEPEIQGGLKLTVMKGDAVGQTYTVTKGRCVIGADVRCGIRIVDVGVSPRHAAFTVRVGQLVLEDLGGPRGTYVNGRKITMRPIISGDMIRIGECELLVHM
jgi:hypothetical protein